MNRESSVMKLDKNGMIKHNQNNKLELNKPITVLHIFILLALIITSLTLNFMSTTTRLTLIRLETSQIGIEYCLDACLCGIVFSFCIASSNRQFIRDPSSGRIYLVISTKLKIEEQVNRD